MGQPAMFMPGRDSAKYISFDTIDRVPDSCDWGRCSKTPIGVRWDQDERRWLPVCGDHAAGTPGRRTADRMRTPYPIEGDGGEAA